MATELAELTSGTMEALNLLDTKQQEEMTNLTTMNKTLIETIQQQQNDINDLKLAVTKQPATTITTKSRDDGIMKNLMKMIKGNDKNKEIFYCWTHGFNTNPDHTSCTCKWPAEGHIREATKND